MSDEIAEGPPIGTMGTVEQRLFEILVEHDVAIAERNAQRTEKCWPDLSDIHTETRRKIFGLFKIKDVLDRQDKAGLPLDLTAENEYQIGGQQAFSIKPESPIDPSDYLNHVVLINGRRYRVVNVERHPVVEQVNTLRFGLMVIPA